MKILAFETSCDETSCAVIEDGRKILSNVISTQVPIHKKFGGVVPEIASRHHIEDVLPVAIEALEEARAGWEDIDAVAVTQGPGLVGALLVGVAAAKTAAWVLGKPLIAVNHMEGHIFANLLQYSDLEPPFLSLVVSGGHTMLVVVRDYNTFVEAMANGCVVVASRTGGLPEVVHDGEVGLLHEVGSIDDMANKIVSLIATPELLQKYSSEAIRYVRRYSFERYSQLFNDLYKRLITTKR